MFVPSYVVNISLRTRVCGAVESERVCEKFDTRRNLVECLCVERTKERLEKKKHA